MTNRLSPPNGRANGKVQPPVADDGTLADVQEREVPPKASNNIKATPDHWTTEQSMILRQSSVWSRGVVWGIVGVTVISLIWANVATMEEVIPATGQLKPLDTVKEVQAPVNGVVKTVLVKDNERVRQGQPLVIMDSTTTVSDLESARKIKQATLQENAFYYSVLQEGISSNQLDLAISQLR
jgi:HlyD family secretion protein